jgi:prepilin-type N-terminal cleavage/methylation domain-containing protein
MRYTPANPHALSIRRRGFTAIEALIAATILAILTASVSGALSAGRAQAKLARDTLSASFLAQSMMDEIMRLPYDDPLGYTTLGPDPGQATRSTFNNIDDYYGYTDGPNNLTDYAGNSYPSTYQSFTRAVTMTAISSTPTGWNRTVTGLLVIVTVSRDGVELVKLQRIAWD